MTDANDIPTTESTAKPAKIRLWPAVIVSVLGAGTTLAIQQFGSTNYHNFVGIGLAPLVGFVLLLLWWLFASRVPWKHRALGLLVFFPLLGGLYFTHAGDGQANPIFIVVTALPYLCYGAVLVLLVTSRMTWGAQARRAMIYLFACAVVFGAMRVDSMGGDLAPVLTWRWETGVEEAPPPALPADSPGKVATLPEALVTEDWPAFRGPNRDSHLAGVRFSTDWGGGPREVWRHRVGIGWSSYAAVGEYLFTQEQRGEQESVACYRADTGEAVWISSVAASFVDVSGSGPRATPTYEGGKLYAMGATGTLQCLDAATGAEVWRRDMAADTGADVPQWGFASSPLIVDDLLILFCGGSNESSVVAYNKRDGELVWNTGKGKRGYSSGHLVTFADVPQVLMSSNFGIQSYVPQSGEVLWEHAWEVNTNPRVVQPLVSPENAVMIGTAAGMGMRRLAVTHEAGAWNVEEAWTTRKYRPYFNDGILYEGHCYGFDGNRLSCIDAHTGEMQWRGERMGGQLLFVRDMKSLLILTEEGEVVIVPTTPEAFTVTARFQALSGKTWNHPVIARGKLYVRNAEEAACFELAGM
jgi:outer membrane protein assembly factor BamB